jgi:hypothetical protein
MNTEPLQSHSYAGYSDAIEVLQPDEDELIDKIVASMAQVNQGAINTAMRPVTRMPRATACWSGF